MKIRIEMGKYENEYAYTCQSNPTHGLIDKVYISKEKQKEVKECGYAYTNKDRSLCIKLG